jgi:hypothetical protein
MSDWQLPNSAGTSTLLTDVHLRRAHRYALREGFAHGWPNFEQAVYPDRGWVAGTFLVNGVDHADVPRHDLGQPQPALSDIQACWRGAHRWAVSHGYVAGVPTFEQADHGQGVVYGVSLLGAATPAQVRDVPRSELYHRPTFDQPEAVVRSANRWALQHGFSAGIPTFEAIDHGDGLGPLYGVVMLAAGPWLEWRDVPVSEYERVVPAITYQDLATARAICESQDLGLMWDVPPGHVPNTQQPAPGDKVFVEVAVRGLYL